MAQSLEKTGLVKLTKLFKKPMFYPHKSIMDDYNFEDKTSAEVVSSYTSYKGKNTMATRKLELILDLQSKSYSAVTATSINEQISKTERIGFKV